MFNVTHYSRVISHLKKEQSPEELKKSLRIIGNKLRSLEFLRLIFVILLYSSIISAMTSTVLPELGPLLKEILKFSGLIGSTFSLIMFAITSRYIGLYIIEMQIIAAKLISQNGLRRTKLRNKKK